MYVFINTKTHLSFFTLLLFWVFIWIYMTSLCRTWCLLSEPLIYNLYIDVLTLNKTKCPINLSIHLLYYNFFIIILYFMFLSDMHTVKTLFCFNSFTSCRVVMNVLLLPLTEPSRYGRWSCISRFGGRHFSTHLKLIVVENMSLVAVHFFLRKNTATCLVCVSARDVGVRVSDASFADPEIAVIMKSVKRFSVCIETMVKPIRLWGQQYHL